MVKLNTISKLLIGAMIYEIVLKVLLLVFPSLTGIAGVKWFVIILKFCVGVIMLLYAYRLYQNESGNSSIRIILQLLLVVIALNVVIRLPMIRSQLDLTISRLIENALSLGISLLILILFILLYQIAGNYQRKYRIAVLGMIVIFCLNSLLGAMKLVQFLQFLSGDETIEPTQYFMEGVMISFALTRIVVINFAYQYNKRSNSSRVGI